MPTRTSRFVALAGSASTLALVVTLLVTQHQADAADREPAIVSDSATATPAAAQLEGAVPYLAHPADPAPEIIIRSVSPEPQLPSLRSIPANPKPASAAKRAAQSHSKRVLMMEVTAYCPCKVCCGRRAQGITASGKTVGYNGGAFVAADKAVLPFFSSISVPGYNGGRAIPVIDTGGDIIGHRLDVFFRSHSDAEQWGRKLLPVTVISKGKK